MSNIEQKEQEIIEDFSFFDNWEDRYDYVISLGKKLPLIAPEFKTDQLLIKGCQNNVWLHAKLEDGTVIFTADSDAFITKGIISILVYVLSNETPDAILAADLGFLETIKLQEHLNLTRSNGLVSMVKQMKLYALAFRTQQNNPS